MRVREALNYDYNTHATGGYNTVSGNKWGWSDGTLAVSFGTVKPQAGRIFPSRTNLVLTGGGGAAGHGLSILGSTNLAAPLTNWPLAATGVCDSSGNLIVTNSLSATNRWQFYAIRIP